MLQVKFHCNMPTSLHAGRKNSTENEPECDYIGLRAWKDVDYVRPCSLGDMRLPTAKLIRHQLEYAAPIWDPNTQEKKTPAGKVQHRAARWTTSNFVYLSSTTATVDKLGWRTLVTTGRCPSMSVFQIVHGLAGCCTPS